MEDMHEISTRDIPFYVPAVPNLESKKSMVLLKLRWAFPFQLIFYIFQGVDTVQKHIRTPNQSQDFHLHSQLCHDLLEHYAAQWRDREVYWRARERSSLHGDLLTVIIDSFDRSKLYLPKFPFNRIPKRPAYQAYSRILDFRV